MGFPKIRPNQPLGPTECVEQKLLGGLVPVHWPSIVFPVEVEQSCPLVLPDGGVGVRRHDDLVAGATQRLDQGHWLRLVQLVHVVAFLVAHEAVAVLEGPLGTGRLSALVGVGLHGDVVPDAAQLALGGGGVAGAGHRPGIGRHLPMGLGYQHVGVAHWQVAPLQ